MCGREWSPQPGESVTLCDSGDEAAEIAGSYVGRNGKVDRKIGDAWDVRFDDDQIIRVRSSQIRKKDCAGRTNSDAENSSIEKKGDHGVNGVNTNQTLTVMKADFNLTDAATRNNHDGNLSQSRKGSDGGPPLPGRGLRNTLSANGCGLLADPRCEHVKLSRSDLQATVATVGVTESSAGCAICLIFSESSMI